MENIESLKHSIIFITPLGETYVVPDDETIEEFAEFHNLLNLGYDLQTIFEKIKLINELEDIDLSYSDLLINILGYILYVDSEITYPDPWINNRYITSQQLVVLNRLLDKKENIKILNKLTQKKLTI